MLTMTAMKATKKKLTKAVLKHDGNMSKAAKELGITKQSVARRVQKNPEIKEAVESVREKALRAAGAERVEVFKTFVDGMRSQVWDLNPFTGKVTREPNFKERRENAKILAQLFGDLTDTPQTGPVNIFNFYIPEKKPLDAIDAITLAPTA